MNLSNNSLLTFLQFSECGNFNMESLMGVVENVLDTPKIDQLKGDTPIRIVDFFDLVIPAYTLDDFYKHFRISRSTFMKLHDTIRQGLGDRGKVPLQKKILFSLWFIAKEECFLSTSDRFGIAPSTAHLIFGEIIRAISNLTFVYIQFPDYVKQIQIAAEFEAKSGIPGVVGAIDGSNFYNRKSVHSIVLQAVCDNNRKFLDIYVGSPGRMHDSRVFRTSGIYAKLIDADDPLLPETHHISVTQRTPIQISWLHHLNKTDISQSIKKISTLK